MNNDCRNLLKAVFAELALNADDRRRIVAVARTIANLDGRERIETSHICEAINYRMMGR
jgi:magnesium chelatase family protein